VPPGLFRRPGEGPEPERHRSAAGRGPSDGQRAAGSLGDAAGNVQAEAGGAAAGLAAKGRVGRAESGPVVRDHQPRAPRGAPAEPHGEAGALRGVREHVPQQDVRAGGKVVYGDEDRDGSRDDVYGHPAILVLGERPPERGPFGDHPGRVAHHRHAPGTGPPRLPDDLADGPFHRVHVGEQPFHLGAIPQRLGVDPQRG
jgi:hypothetical protein